MQVADAPACKAFIGAIDAIRVTAADAQRDLALQQGARRSFTWDYVKRLPMVEEVPDAVRESMIAREAYLRDVPPACDHENRREAFAFYVGDRYFAYGHFAEARRFLTPLFEQACKTSPFGYRTWVDLITMSNSDGNDEQSRRLAEAQKAHPCAGDRLETEASFDFRQWRPGGTMAGDPSTRQKAISSLRRFHDVYRGRAAPAAYVVEAAYRIAKLEQSVGNANFRAWFKTVLIDWLLFQSHPSRVSASDPRWAEYLEETNMAVREDKFAARTPGRAGILGGAGVDSLPHPTPVP